MADSSLLRHIKIIIIIIWIFSLSSVDNELDIPLIPVRLVLVSGCDVEKPLSVRPRSSLFVGDFLRVLNRWDLFIFLTHS